MYAIRSYYALVHAPGLRIGLQFGIGIPFVAKLMLQQKIGKATEQFPLVGGTESDRVIEGLTNGISYNFV